MREDAAVTRAISSSENGPGPPCAVLPVSPVFIFGHLRLRHLGQGVELDATIIILLAVPGRDADEALVDRGVDLLLERGEEPKERMALAA